MEPVIEILNVGALEVNCYIFGCSEHKIAFIIDPGDNPQAITDKLDSLNLKAQKIINTHAHADHIGGNGPLKKKFSIPILIHHDDSVYLSSPENSDMAAYYGTQPSPEADQLLNDGDLIKLCDHFSIQVIHTPGHSPGGICLKYKKFIFTGDTLFANSIGRTDLPGGSFDTILNSIKNKILVNDEDSRIFPGHGNDSTIRNEKQYNPFIR